MKLRTSLAPQEAKASPRLWDTVVKEFKSMAKTKSARCDIPVHKRLEELALCNEEKAESEDELVQ